MTHGVLSRTAMAERWARSLAVPHLMGDAVKLEHLPTDLVVIESARHPLVMIAGDQLAWSVDLERMEDEAQVPTSAPERALPFWAAYTGGTVPKAALARLAQADVALGGELIALLADAAAEADDEEPNYSRRLRHALLREERRLAQA